MKKLFDSRFLAVGMLLNGKLCSQAQSKNM